MSFVIYNKSTFKRLSLGGQESFSSERVAKGILTKACKKSASEAHFVDRVLQPPKIVREDYIISTYDAWAAAEPMVTVFSIFDLKKERPIQIRATQRGGCCDPSMELYHTM